MENTKISISALILAVLFGVVFVNCKNEDKQTSEDKPKQEIVERPDQIIDIKVARQQYLTYEKRRVELIQRYEDSIDGYYDKDKIRKEKKAQGNRQNPNDPNGERFDVGRYVYWDYETIKNYLKYIEQEAKAADIEISSLRFYFSNYDRDSKNVHPRQNSIMITPTLRENDREYIFEIDDSDPENLKPRLLTDAFEIKNQEKGMGHIYKNSQRSYASIVPGTMEPNSAVLPYYQGKSVTMNRGSGAPPPYNEK